MSSQTDTVNRKIISLGNKHELLNTFHCLLPSVMGENQLHPEMQPSATFLLGADGVDRAIHKGWVSFPIKSTGLFFFFYLLYSFSLCFLYYIAGMKLNSNYNLFFLTTCWSVLGMELHAVWRMDLTIDHWHCCIQGILFSSGLRLVH